MIKDCKIQTKRRITKLLINPLAHLRHTLFGGMSSEKHYGLCFGDARDRFFDNFNRTVYASPLEQIGLRFGWVHANSRETQARFRCRSKQSPQTHPAR
jgi:hypothetical protein